MKTILTYFSFCIMVLLPITSFAKVVAPSESLTIKVPKNTASRVCKHKFTPGINVIWGGVKDLRKSKQIARLENKNEGSVSMITDKPLVDYLDEFIPSVLQKCGLNFVNKVQKRGYKITASIKEFSAHADTGFKKPKTVAKSVVTIYFKNRFAKIKVNADSLVESKGLNTNRKKLERMMSKLFVETLGKMATSEKLDFLRP